MIMENNVSRLFLVLVLILTIITVPAFADNYPQISDQTLTVPGMTIYLNGDGSPPAKDPVVDNGNGTVTTSITHLTPVPNGTTKAEISFNRNDVSKAGTEGNFNNNGHDVTTGKDVYDTYGNRIPSDGVIKVIGNQEIVTINGQTFLRWTAELTVSKDYIQRTPMVPPEVIDMARNLENEPNKDAVVAALLAEYGKHYQSTDPNFDPTSLLMNIALDPEWYEKQSMAMVPMPGVVTILDTKEAQERRALEGIVVPPPTPTDCPTGEFWVTIPKERSVFLYTYTSTTDLPTPPTRNHGPCPAFDNEGYTEWDAAWGAGKFPTAGEGEHWKYWSPSEVNKGYNKSIHYETRGIVPAATSPANKISGRPVATTQWTPIFDNKLEVFRAEPVGRIEYKWVDNSHPTRDGYEIKEEVNQTRYCVEAYERLVEPKKQRWKHDKYQKYQWNFCMELWDHDSPADSHCIGGYVEECAKSKDKDGKETETCYDTCPGGYEYHDAGYHYTKYSPKGGYNTDEWNGGMYEETSEDGIIPPVYEPWRKWKHRTELEVEFHASIVAPNNKLMNFNKLDNPQIKSGYGVMYEGQAQLITDWDRDIVLSANLIRPNRTTPLKLNEKNTPVFNANGNASPGVSGSTEAKDYIRDILQITNSGATLNYSTKKGTWHAYPNIKGNQKVIPKFGQSRQHFIHTDYPDGTFNVEAWINADLVGGKSSWKVNHADVKGITVKGNMFSDSFVRPK